MKSWILVDRMQNNRNFTLSRLSLTLKGFAQELRSFAHPSPPAAGRCKAQIKKSRSSKLDATFLCALRRVRDVPHC